MVVASSLKCYEVSVSVPQGSFLYKRLYGILIVKRLLKCLEGGENLIKKREGT